MRLKFNLQSSSSGTHTAIFPFQLFPQFNPTHVQSITLPIQPALKPPNHPAGHPALRVPSPRCSLLSAWSAHQAKTSTALDISPHTQHPKHLSMSCAAQWVNVKWALMGRVKKASWSPAPCVSRGREQLGGEVTVHALRCGNQCLLQIKPAMPTITVLCCCCPSTFQVIL